MKVCNPNPQPAPTTRNQPCTNGWWKMRRLTPNSRAAHGAAVPRGPATIRAMQTTGKSWQLVEVRAVPKPRPVKSVDDVRGLSPLSHASKIVASIVNNRLLQYHYKFTSRDLAEPGRIPTGRSTSGLGTRPAAKLGISLKARNQPRRTAGPPHRSNITAH